MDKYPLPPSFRIIANFIIDEIERGHANVPGDRGGDTNFGVSDARDGKRDGLIDLDNDGTGDIPPAKLIREQALQIYWRDYWTAARCDQLPVRMAAFVFDGAINHRRLRNGGFVGCKLLQLALGVTADGILGPESLKRAWQYKDQREVLPLAFAHRAELFHGIVVADSTQAKFLKGWFKRLFFLQQFINSLVTDPKEVRP